jgi:phosphoribosyl 1,2-cyclic phosphate phosphodiesterase
MRLRVRLLGTGPSPGVPNIGGDDEAGDWGACDPAEPRNRRTRTAALIEAADGTRLLIDPGPDIRAQLLAARVARLDAVLITHAHADHVMGLDELRAVNRATGQALAVHAMAETLADLTQRFGYAFLAPTRGFYRPALLPLVAEPGSRLQIGPLKLELIEQDHAVMRTLGLRIGGFAYCTDVVRLPEVSLATLQGVEAWVVGCFQHEPHHVHAHLALVMEWSARIGARRTVLTHMSNRLDFASLKAELPPGFEPGFDGMELSLG